MKHQDSEFTRILLEGKPYWCIQDGTWIFPVVSGGDGEDDDTDPDKDGGDRPTITQKQLDEILKNRVGKAKESAVRELLKELGIEDKEQVKQILAKSKEADEKNKTELEKAQGEASEFKSKHTAVSSDFESYKLSVAVQFALIAEGLTTDQAKVAAKLVDVTELDEEKVKAGVEELKKTMPQLFQAADSPGVQGGNPGTPPPGGGGNGNDPDQIAMRILHERHPATAKK